MSATAVDADTHSSASHPQDSDEGGDTEVAATATATATAAATELAQLAADEAAARRRRLVEQWRAVFGDAEHACARLVYDVVDDLFAEMRVVEETRRSVELVARHTTREVFASLAICAVAPSESLDRVSAQWEDATDAARDSVAGGRHIMQQVLKPLEPQAGDEQNDVSSADDASNDSATRTQLRSREHLAHATCVSCLRVLATAFELQPSVMSTALLAFPRSTFTSMPHHRHNPAHGVDPHDYHSPMASPAIPASELSNFLDHFVAVANLCVLPSAVQFVVSTTTQATVETTKYKHTHKTRATTLTLTLPQIQRCVQRALVAAETSAFVPSTQDAQETWERIVVSAHKDDCLLFRACYSDEGEPLRPAIDCNAPGRHAKKPTAASKQAVVRQVVQAMTTRPGLSPNSRWRALRSRVHPTGDSATTDGVAGPVRVDGDSHTSPHKTRAHTQSSFAIATLLTDANTSGSSLDRRLKPLVIEPDTAALANIFGLGTPRQLSADELARRSDILSLLEREQQRHDRRMAHAAIAAMAMATTSPLSPTLVVSEADRTTYQAYVAANSSITVPLQAAAVVGAGGDGFTPQSTTVGVRSPTRPPGDRTTTSENPNPSSRSRQLLTRTKFDVAREPPAFVVSEGNAHVRDDNERHRLEDPALRSPATRRPKMRAIRPTAAPEGASSSSHVVAPPAASPIRVAERIPTDVAPAPHVADNPACRPVEPASQLPQLETARLAVGVRAVVRGVEKRGPRRSPSRKSRLKLHNYTVRPPLSLLIASFASSSA